MTREEWRSASMDQIGKAIGRARKRTGMSQQELADIIGSTRNAVQNLESPRGRKSSLNVFDLVEIAAALDIPPILLLFPRYPDGNVEVLPGVESTSEEAARWFAGDAPIPGTGASPVEGGVDGPRYVIHRVNDGIRLVDAARKRREQPRIGAAMLQTLAAREDLSEVERRGLSEEMERLHAERVRLGQEIEHLRERMFDDGR